MTFATEGKDDELFGRIQKRTGETREVVEREVRAALENDPVMSR